MNGQTTNIFVLVAAAAIVLQFLVLFAMYLMMRRGQKQVADVVSDLKQHGVPAMIAANNFFAENGPKVSTILDNAAATTTTVRAQVERIDATVNDVLDRTRLQVIRTDELVSRTLDRVEQTTDIVEHRVLTPIKRIAGLVTGVTAGLGALMGGMKGNGRGRNSDDGEMFI
jgi:histidinol dehydrogenase